MLYSYTASTKNGRLLEGEYEAESEEEVLGFLAGRGLTPVSVKSMKKKRKVGVGLFDNINLADKLFLTKYLSLMLGVGTDLLSAIDILIGDFEKPAVKNFLLEVRDNLSRGRPFYEAFKRYPKLFSKVFVSLVKAGEESGNLQEVFKDLSINMEKEAELKRKIKSAMLYPIIILCSSLVIATFLTTFALPRIANVFLQGGVEPPTFSRIVFSVGLFVGNNVWTILISLSVLVGSSLFFILKTRAGKDMVAKAAIRLPLVRNLLNELAIQRFSSTFGILLSAGIPIIEALRITSDVVGIPKFRDALIRIADEGLAKGLTIGDAFKREGVFPKTVVNLVAISEKAGHLEEVLETLADFYASNVDAGIKTAVSFLEPALLLFMGLIVGTIALSIIVPIYQLTSQF